MSISLIRFFILIALIFANTSVDAIWTGFRDQAVYKVHEKPIATTVADFTGKGIPDIAVLCQCEEVGVVDILINNGSGQFILTNSYPVGKEPINIVSGDFRNIGIQDIAVANKGDGTITILFGNGNGTFETPLTIPVEGKIANILAADINSDILIDLAVLLSDGDRNNAAIAIYSGTGSRTFLKTESSPLGNNPTNFVCGSFHDSNQMDLAVASFDDESVSILLNTGNCPFTKTHEYPVDGSPIGIDCGDIFGRNSCDIVTANASTSTVSLLKGKGDGTFQAQCSYKVGKNSKSQPSHIALGNLSGKDTLDIATTLRDDNAVSVLLSPDFKKEKTFAVGDSPNHIILCDVSNDGKCDAIVTNYLSSSVSVLLNKLPQKIRFPAILDQQCGTPSIILSATSDSGLPVSFKVISGPAKLSGNTLMISGCGEIIVAAYQQGNGVFDIAEEVIRKFTVPTIKFTGIKVKNSFLTYSSTVNKLQWEKCDIPTAVGYHLYRNGRLIAHFPDSGPFYYEDHDRKKNQTDKYLLAIIDVFGKTLFELSLKL